MYSVTSFKVKNLEDRVESGILLANSLSKVQLLYNEVNIRENFINSEKYNKVFVVYTLKEISYIIPNQVMLSSLLVDSDAGLVELRGVVTPATATNVLSEFLKSLGNSPLFSKASLESYEKISVQGVPSVQFEIELTNIE